jgi:hypothetical protein
MSAPAAARLPRLDHATDARSAFQDSAWDAQLAKLESYKAAHGDCNVPNRWAKEPRLGRWVHTQRKRKRKLDRGESSSCLEPSPSLGMTADRAARLEALGFVWDPDEAAWEAQLARLAAYKAAHGDCNVPRGWAEDPRLGRWVMAQRQYKKKLARGEPSPGMTAERVARLEALGFIWALDEAVWEMQFARLAAYKAVYGDCNVPQGWAEDPRLATWVSTQRKGKRMLASGTLGPSEGMTAVRAARLTALGIVWAPDAAYERTTKPLTKPWKPKPSLSSWPTQQSLSQAPRRRR